MSFNLTISGHHSDAKAAEAIDAKVLESARALVAELREAEGISGLSATFSGPSGFVNLVGERAAAPLNQGSGAERLGAAPAPVDDDASS